MGALNTALVVVMCINVMLFMGEISTQGINPSHPNIFKCSESGLMSDFETGSCRGSNYTLNQDTGKATSYLPNAQPTTDTTSGNIFTDIYNAIRGFITSATTGIKYFVEILFSPMHFLSRIFPSGMEAYAYALGFLWYGITLFLFINWIKGGDA